MPFKSNAQRKFLAMKMTKGLFSKEKFDEFAKATPDIKKLPEHKKPEKKTKQIKIL